MPEDLPTPTDPRLKVDSEFRRWNRIFAGDRFYYGEEPGPVARRAVRYHRPHLPSGGTALDAGCGEGQDLAFLVERGYEATGIEFTPEGARKARRFLAERSLEAEVLEQDLRTLDPSRRYDVVLAVNSVQFMGADAPECLDRLMAAVAPGGVIGLSLFGREEGKPSVWQTFFFITLDELLERFRAAPEPWQPLETANLRQWHPSTGEPQGFVTLIARKAPSARRSLLRLEQEGR